MYETIKMASFHIGGKYHGILIATMTYYFVINIITFILFGADKRRAVTGRFRIPNRVLLGLSFIGGALGGSIAMYAFRHKTQQPKYAAGLPLMLLAQAAVIFYLSSRP